jgi:sialate O-acetylesterase
MNRLLFLLLLSFGAFSVHAEIKLPSLVGSNMVLQRDMPILVWGFGTPDEQLTISFNNKLTKTKVSESGKWTAILPKMKAGGPYTMTLTGTNKLVLENILIGDVWLCSGQSNMEFALKSGLNAEQEIADAKYPAIRLYTVAKKIALKPEEDSQGSWTECSPETARNFSAIGYFFGRKIHQDVNVPVGLINSSWGGTVVETWISPTGIQREPTFGKVAATVADFDTAGYNSEHRRLNADWVKNFNSQDEGFKGGEYLWAKTNAGSWNTVKLPDGWEFSGVADLWQLDGVVWFRKDVTLTAADLTGTAILNLGVIQNADITFVNGQKIGQTPDAWGIKRRYTIPAGVLKEGLNSITVRVENYGGDGGFSNTPQDFFLKTGDKEQSLVGEWKYKIGYKQTVSDRPQKEVGPNTLPTLLYNSMINPLINYNIKGVLWYQGESNASRAFQYRTLFPMMITDWRQKFDQGDFPFLYVQLANYSAKRQDPGESNWAELREAQALTLSTRNTAMTTAVDVGDAANIHPKNKQALGLRLAMLAEQLVYRMPVKGLHPAFSNFSVQDKSILVHVKNANGSVKTANGKAPGNFQIAGADHKFYWATAEILDQNTIKISSAEVAQPVAARYAWEDNPADANVVNAENLPLLPFRTDNWKGLTDDKK